MKWVHRLGLVQRLVAILLLAIVLDTAANVILLDRANAVQLHHDDAERIAGRALLASRLLELLSGPERPAAARNLSTPHFRIYWSRTRPVTGPGVGLASMRDLIVTQAPELKRRDLRLHVGRSIKGNAIGGSLLLGDGSAMVFETNVRSAWTLNTGGLIGIAFPNVVLIFAVWLLSRATLEPLRALVSATRQVGTAPPRAIPQRGPREVRLLIAAINQMQRRIDQSLRDRTQTMLAIGHDLRTPLSRMRLRLENLQDSESAALPDDPTSELVRNTRLDLEGDISEMLHLLDSLQAYVESGGREMPPEPLDLAVMAATLVDSAADLGADAVYFGPDSLEITAPVVALRRALSNLISNALHYGGNAKVVLTALASEITIAVEDDGPGIPQDRLAEVLQPFVRLDAARARDTAGMGLGLAIVDRAVRAAGGQLELRNRPQGGLRAVIRLPRSLAPSPIAPTAPQRISQRSNTS